MCVQLSVFPVEGLTMPNSAFEYGCSKQHKTLAFRQETFLLEQQLHTVKYTNFVSSFPLFLIKVLLVLLT